MARTADQLTNEEVLIVQGLNNLANSAANEFLAKVGGTFVNKVQTGGGGGGTAINNEVMGGTVNGINKIFTLASIPSANSEHIYVEGQRLTPTIDYIISGLTVTLVNAPTLNSPLADYTI